MSQDIRKRLMKVCDRLDKLYQERAELKAQMDELESQGITDASPHWRRRDDPNGKPDLLELVHPTKSSYARKHGRRREYVGTDEAKIQEALGRVKRWGFHRKFKSDHNENWWQIQRIERQIDSLERTTFSKQASLW